jgi:hypothetical protein
MPARVFVAAVLRPRQTESQSAGSFSKVFGTIVSRTEGGVPMSATTTSPHNKRPGNNNGPASYEKK